MPDSKLPCNFENFDVPLLDVNTTTMHYTLIMEQTPNPETIRFITNQILLPSGKVLQFTNSEKTDVAPLAKVLLGFPFVKEILIAENYISVTKNYNVLWEDILLELRDYLYAYLNAGKPILNTDLLEKYLGNGNEDISNATEGIGEVAVQHNTPQSEIEQKIIDILNEYILPAVSQDGGFITFEEYRDGIVYLKMRGACSGCPGSALTLKAGIEALLKKMLPNDVREVKSESI